MIATYYDLSLAGHMAASGEPLDPEEYAAAHRILPLGTRLLVSYVENPFGLPSTTVDRTSPDTT
jgi:rare lipoprotein A (peptidoglycan hydrolase)